MSRPTRQFIDALLAAWNSHDVERAAEFYALDYAGVDVSQSAPHHGHTGIRQMLTTYLTAFPDLQFTNEVPIVEDNRAAMSWVAHGTHLGHLMNIPPTGRQVRVRGVSLLTIENDKVQRATYIWDVAGLLRDIELLPELWHGLRAHGGIFCQDILYKGTTNHVHHNNKHSSHSRAIAPSVGVPLWVPPAL